MNQIGSLLAVLSIFGSLAGRNSLAGIPSLAGAAQPQVTLTQDGLVLEWRAPQPNIAMRDGAAQVTMPGYAQSGWPGSPSLPLAGAWIALPPTAEPSIEILETVESDLLLPAPPALAPGPSGVYRDQFGQAIGGALAPAVSPADFPEQAVALEGAGVLRGQRLTRLLFYPVRPSTAGLRLTEFLRVAVHFNAPLRPAGQAAQAGDPLLEALSRQVINPEQLQPAFPSSAINILEPGRLADPATQVAIEVSQPGMTVLTYQALKTSGFPVDTVNPHNLHLARAGQDVAYQWQGNGDDRFELGERLLFFAEPRFSRWTVGDVYFLSADVNPGTLMGSRSAAPTGQPAGTAWADATFEQNILYTPDCYCAPIPAGRDGDRWTWESLQWPSRTTASYSFDLPAVDPTRGGTLTVWLIGFTDLAEQPDHLVEISLNGQPLGSKKWDGKQAAQANLNIPPGLLVTSQNILTLKLPTQRVEGVWLDAFRVQYVRGSAASGEALLFSGETTPRIYTIGLTGSGTLRAYDATNADKPVRLTGLQVNGQTITLGEADSGVHRYWLDTRLRPPDLVRPAASLRSGRQGGADYVVISPEKFIPALASLVQLRQGQGLQVVVEDVQAIYDNFGDGRPDPAAIRAFLAHAYATWKPRPAYVLLAGDGTSDPKLYNPTSSPTFIPPYLEVVDPWAGETASDNRYATLDGADILPDLLIGRLPGNSAAEVMGMADKIVDYETQAGLQTWSHQALYVTDNPDKAGDFPGMAEKVIHSLPGSPQQPLRLYYDPQQISRDGFRQQLHSLWNEGAGLVLYAGHASILQWAEERFLEIEDIPNLKNGKRLPVLLDMTCFTGAFQVPGFKTMDESLLRQPGGGVAAAWGSTGLGLLTGHRWLAQGFIAELYSTRQATLGQAALAGKLTLDREGFFYEDLIDTYTLLGDPAMQVIQSDIDYLPLILQSP